MELDEDHAEFCGIIMGDGNLWTNNRKYEVTITGDIKNDKEYFNALASFVRNKIGKEPYYRIRGRGLRITIYSKEYYKFLTDKVGMKDRMLKSESGFPASIKGNETFLRRFIRGLFDTDGTIFLSDKKGSPDYPTLEIASSNLKLVDELHTALSGFNFRVHKRKTTKNGYKVSIYGKEMIRKWSSLIGSSNPHKKAKMEDILK